MSSSDLKYELFERAMMDAQRGQRMNPLEQYVAGLLLDASSEQPMKIDDLIARVAESHLRVRLTPRTVKDLIRTLRRDRMLPILSRKGQRSRKKTAKLPGYWWANSSEEMLEFYQAFRAQAMDELQTAAIMVRGNFPELAGQLDLGF